MQEPTHRIPRHSNGTELHRIKLHWHTAPPRRRAAASTTSSSSSTSSSTSEQFSDSGACASDEVASSGAMHLASRLAAQYQQAAQQYGRLQQHHLKLRVARARSRTSARKASALMGALQEQQPASAGQQQQAARACPSLPALTLVVKMLLSLAAARVSAAFAGQLRMQVLQQVKAAAAAAKEAGQPFSVSESLHAMLPRLRSAVLHACKQQQGAADGGDGAADSTPRVHKRSACSSGSAAAAVEAALTTAACEAQLCGLQLSAVACERAADSISSSSLEMLLQAELASAMSACP